MSPENYLGVGLALAIGIACMVFRRPMAKNAVRSHERLYGARWNPRSFEVGFTLAGIACIAWALFMLLGALVFAPRR